jgi:hypothetical protein
VVFVASHRIQSLRKEHEKLLDLVGGIEKMLELASRNVFSEHLKSLKGLQLLEPGLASVEQHCHAEERTIERTFKHSLQEEERARIDAEHEQIIGAVTNLREELKSATADRTMAMICQEWMSSSVCVLTSHTSEKCSAELFL